MPFTFESKFEQNLHLRLKNALGPLEFLQSWRLFFESAVKHFDEFISPVLADLAESTQFSHENLRAGLSVMFRGFAESKLAVWPEKLLADSPKIAIVAAGNIPGVAITPALQAAAIGCPVIVKLARQDQILLPYLIEKFERKYGATGISCAYWPHEAPELHKLLAAAGKILAFGTDSTMASLENLFPGKIIGFGHKFSIGIIDDVDISESIYAGLALDTVLFQQAGCLSPQVFFVRGSRTNAHQFAGQYFENLQRKMDALQMPILEPAEHYQRRILLDELDLNGEFYFSDSHGTAVVIVGEGLELPRLLGAHVVQINHFKTETELTNMLQPIAQWLQGCVLACGASNRPVWQDLLAKAGCTWIARPGQLQGPPLLWKNGGFSLIDRIYREFSNQTEHFRANQNFQ